MVAEQANVQQTEEQTTSLSLDWMVCNLRWLWLLIVASFVLADMLFAEAPSEYSRELLGLVGLAVFLNIAYAGLLWAKFYPGWVAVGATLFDAIVAVIVLILFDDYILYLLPVALFPVLIAGVRWSIEAGLIMAIVVSMGYAFPLIWAFVSEEDVERSQLMETLFLLGANGLVLILAAILPGAFIGQRIHSAEAENEAELKRLRIESERGRLFSEMALTLSSTLNYHKVLRATIDAAFAAMVDVGTKDDSTIAMVLLFEDDERLVVAAGRNISRNDQGRKVNAKRGVIGKTVDVAETVITHEAQNDKSINSFASTPGCRSAICAPLRAGFNTFGVILFCSTEPNHYNNEHKALLSTFCSQAIIALQNAQLFEDVRHEQEKILEKEAEARKKLARDLHDGPTQSVAAIVMRLNFIKLVLENDDVEKALDEVVKVEEIAKRTTQEIRTMLFAMRPVILETQGLVAALTQYADRLNENEPFNVNISNRGYDGQLNHEAEGVVFAIVEEAVGNAKKHAQASQINININAKNDSLLVEIKDNGVGFNVEATQSTYDQRTSLGLINMDERAELVGGECSLYSAKGKGTTVSVQIPFNRNTEVE